jgi:MFS transporter, DHA1 family, inner membrane transport protein
MGDEGASTGKRLKRGLLLPTLVLSYFTIVSFGVFSGTLLLDIARAFDVSIGTASQGALVGHLVGLVLGLTMGALTLRFKHKSLFLSGPLFLAIGVLGFYFSPNFASLLIASFFIGLGIGMITIMVFSLIGELLPLEKRGWAIGLTFSISFVASVIDAPLFGYIAQVAGWRSPLLWFLFPLSIICLMLGLLVIPSAPHKGASPSKSIYSEAFKQVLVNKSAVACLVGTSLAWIAATIPIYAVSFYRVAYSVSPSTGGTFAAISSAGGIFGAAIGGRLVNRLGRKTLTIAGFFASGVFTVLWTFVPNISASVAFWAISGFFAALAFAAFFSLILEQVPGFRASMMSINGTFQSAGQILGVSIGGLVLNIYSNNFHLLMTIFGSASIGVAVIILLLARDPNKNLPLSSSYP